MEILKKKLSMLNGESSMSKIKLAFDEIANDLFRNYHIKKGAQEYYFINIEFYFCNKNHLDIITYPRQLNEGLWFFHQSGIDLTFKSKYSSCNTMVDVDKEFFFGGILIREIMEMNSGKVFDGPYKCEWELFDKFDAFNPSIHEMPVIVRNTNEIVIEPISSPRRFSYDDERMKRKHKELIQTNYGGKLLISPDSFCQFIREKKYAYRVSTDVLKSKLICL